MSLISQIFGLAASTAYIRCGGSGDNTQLVLEALATGFGSPITNGDYIYNLFNSSTGIFTNSGFDNSSPYFDFEGTVIGLGNGSFSQIGTAAIIFSYATFPNIEESFILNFINSYLSNLSPNIGGGIYSYSSNQLDEVIQQINLSNIYSGITEAPTTITEKIINYNWYDSSSLFINKDMNNEASLIRDVESQYYYVSGQLIYDIPTGLTPCSQFIQTINTPTGQISFRVITNMPCYDPSTYIGPISGIQFFRKFSDGPGSSGMFTSEVMQGYINFDEAVLDTPDYSSNSTTIYSRDFNASGYYYPLDYHIQTDISGYFSPGNEYGFGHTNFWQQDCVNSGMPFPLERMHQGDNLPKLFLTSVLEVHGITTVCVYNTGIFNWTGWKFTRLELSDNLQNNFKLIKTNPQINLDRVVKRALNLDNSLETTFDGTIVISPYLNAVDTGDGVITLVNQVGPPQLNGNSTLPGFAFFQTFYNENFPDFVSICMRPAISACQNGIYEGYSISNFNLFSGINVSPYSIGEIPNLIINQTIYSSGMSKYDDIFKTCIAIGDNLGNNLIWTQSPQSNAGYNYSGYTAFDASGNLINISSLVQNWATIGSKYSEVKYINGYSASGNNYLIGQQYGYIISGDTSSGINYTGPIIQYEYFGDNVLGATNSGWSGGFAPIPIDVMENPNNYTPIYNSQEVENYVPRYTSGPYSSYNTIFLYPNANDIVQTNNSNVNGFPNTIFYNITIKEETVREIYKKINNINSTYYLNVIRALSGNQSGAITTSMIQPFAGNAYSAPEYDLPNYKTGLSNSFNYEASTTSMVDENYIPSTNYCTQLQFNSTIQGSFGDSLSSYWNNGIKLTGNMLPRTVYTGTGHQTGLLYSLQPNAMGLYWVYTNNSYTGLMNYVPPVFDLSKNAITPQQPITSQMDNIGSNLFCYQTPASYTFNGSSKNNLNRTTDYIVDIDNFEGQEPIFFEYMGGRIGNGADLEGGYHSAGIIGDSWYDFQVNTWGNSATPCNTCVKDIFGTEITVDGVGHNPKGDSYVLFFALNPTGINIYTRALNYSPYYFNYSYKPFSTSTLNNIGISTFRNQQSNKEFYFDSDLKNIFPIISSGINDLYYASGINIGPFDRDVELCVLNGRSIIPNGSLIIDGQLMTVNASDANAICTHYINNIALNSGIVPGQYGRNNQITTFKLIPQGTISNINLSGSGILGFKNSSMMTIRPRTFIGANINNYTNPIGDLGFLDNFRYISDQFVQTFSIPSNQFANLQGKNISFITKSNESILYPVPDSDDFDTVVGMNLDNLGNKVYPASPTRVYWLNKTNNDPNFFFSGIREVSRVYVEINQMFISGVQEIPYQYFQNIIPSGKCVISGIFSYTGEAESAIISNGIYLSGISGANALTGIFTPVYISESLQRLPTGIYIFPTGQTPPSPTLVAPSLMMTRKNPFYLTGNDKYISTFPQGLTGDYNQFLWPAWSDFGLLNPEMVYEQMPPIDGNTFLTSFLTFSASKGQPIGTGFNKKENVTYDVVQQYVFVDSLSTDALLNTGICIFSGQVISNILDSGNLNAIMATQGTPLTLNIELNN